MRPTLDPRGGRIDDFMSATTGVGREEEGGGGDRDNGRKK